MSRPLRLGIMGFGLTGRQLYDLAAETDDVQVIAVADVGRSDILHYLLQSESSHPQRYTLEGNFLKTDTQHTRLMSIDTPAEMPWDIFEVDMVIDVTGIYRDEADMRAHLAGGANDSYVHGSRLPPPTGPTGSISSVASSPKTAPGNSSIS